MMAEAGQNLACGCFSVPGTYLVNEKQLGMDDHYAEVSLLTCRVCGQVWLRYLYEFEAVTASGRWYLGAISGGQAVGLTAEKAKETLEGLDWYIYGGSFYGGRSGRLTGRIDLNP